MDYESERLIQDNMSTICKNRTVFVIAHRLSTVQQCHRIIVMEKGRIVEQGNHQTLLAKKGYYAKLHSYQDSPPALQPSKSIAQHTLTNKKNDHKKNDDKDNS